MLGGVGSSAVAMFGYDERNHEFCAIRWHGGSAGEFWRQRASETALARVVRTFWAVFLNVEDGPAESNHLIVDGFGGLAVVVFGSNQWNRK